MSSTLRHARLHPAARFFDRCLTIWLGSPLLVLTLAPAALLLTPLPAAARGFAQVVTAIPRNVTSPTLVASFSELPRSASTPPRHAPSLASLVHARPVARHSEPTILLPTSRFHPSSTPPPLSLPYRPPARPNASPHPCHPCNPWQFFSLSLFSPLLPLPSRLVPFVPLPSPHHFSPPLGSFVQVFPLDRNLGSPPPSDPSDWS